MNIVPVMTMGRNGQRLAPAIRSIVLCGGIGIKVVLPDKQRQTDNTLVDGFHQIDDASPDELLDFISAGGFCYPTVGDAPIGLRQDIQFNFLEICFVREKVPDAFPRRSHCVSFDGIIGWGDRQTLRYGRFGCEVPVVQLCHIFGRSDSLGSRSIELRVGVLLLVNLSLQIPPPCVRADCLTDISGQRPKAATCLEILFCLFGVDPVLLPKAAWKIAINNQPCSTWQVMLYLVAKIPGSWHVGSQQTIQENIQLP